jgi:translation initiation factor 2 subunit 3
MLNGATVMDAALLLVAANETCPQPQTKEHLKAVEQMGLRNFAVIQNKIDLVKPDQARQHFQSVKTFLGRKYSRFIPVIPISARRKINLEYVNQYLANLPLPKRNLDTSPTMKIIRSFDVNKPGTDIEAITGGIAGGTITEGLLKIGQTVEIRPGVVQITKQGVKTCRPIRTKIISMISETQDLALAGPGGLIAVQTTVDPSLTKADRLVGQLLGIPGHLPEIYETLIITYFIMNRVVGVDEDQQESSVARTERQLSENEVIRVHIGSASTEAKVKDVKENTGKILLDFPCCCSIGEKISLSRCIDKRWRLVGYGKIEKESKPVEIT